MIFTGDKNTAYKVIKNLNMTNGVYSNYGACLSPPPVFLTSGENHKFDQRPYKSSSAAFLSIFFSSSVKKWYPFWLILSNISSTRCWVILVDLV
jgi:hypothetical protein